MANKFRKEVEFTLDRQKFAVRPTLAKISRIESEFGATLLLLRKLAASELAIGEVNRLMVIILNGEQGAPLAKDIPELVFQDGAYSFLGPIAEFLGNAITTEDTPAAKPEAAEGN